MSNDGSLEYLKFLQPETSWLENRSREFVLCVDCIAAGGDGFGVGRDIKPGRCAAC